jgi:hypothetical protein
MSKTVIVINRAEISRLEMWEPIDLIIILVKLHDKARPLRAVCISCNVYFIQQYIQVAIQDVAFT